MIREISNPATLTICLADSGFEMTSQWFTDQCQQAIEEHGGDIEPNLQGDLIGRQLFLGLLQFLEHLGSMTPDLVDGLLPSLPQRQFQIGPATLPLDDLPRAANLLHRWWVFADQICRALRHSSLELGGLRPWPSRKSDQPAEEIRGNLLKLRAHLAASILECRPTKYWQGSSERQSVLDYHQSIAQWVYYNLEMRPSTEELLHLKTPYREVGDLLFRCEEPKSWRPRLRPSVEPSRSDWARTRCFKTRPAFLRAAAAFRQKDSKERSKLRRILGEQWRLFRDAESFFLKKFELREFMILSRAAAEVSRQQASLRSAAINAPAIGFILRHLPWPYLGFLILAFLSWGTLGTARLLERTSTTSGAGLALDIAEALFLMQYLVVYGGLSVVTVMTFRRFRRIHSLFEQALPNIFGGILVGYVPLCLTEEMSRMPLTMSWPKILSITAILILLACMYFIVEVASQVRRRGEMLRKAMALSLIALAQSYGLGLIVTSTLGSEYVIQSNDLSTQSTPPAPSEYSNINCDGPLDSVECMEEANILHRLRVMTLGNLEMEFMLFPKLLLLWFSLALFVGIFVESMSNQPRPAPERY
ncbi:MAG: hypothetical protein AAF604_01805 [Acidobacteriota bacterium]